MSFFFQLIASRRLKDGSVVDLTRISFSPLGPALLCLWPGCDVRCFDEVVLDGHVETHFADLKGGRRGEVTAWGQYMADGKYEGGGSMHLSGHSGVGEFSPKLDLMPSALETPIDEFWLLERLSFARRAAAASRSRVRLIWSAMPKRISWGPESMGVRLRHVRGRGVRGLRGRINWVIIGSVSIWPWAIWRRGWCELNEGDLCLSLGVFSIAFHDLVA